MSGKPIGALSGQAIDGYEITNANITNSTIDDVNTSELAVLDGASSTNATTGKVAILGTNGAMGIAGAFTAPSITTAAMTTGTFNTTGNTQIGNAASDTFGVYGATPVVQRATAASHTTIATTVAVSTTSAIWGFSTSTQANAAIAAIAEIQDTLVAIGIWAA